MMVKGKHRDEPVLIGR